MDLKPSHASIPTDPVPINKSRFGIYSSLLDCCQQDSSPSPGMYTRNSSSKSMGSLDDVSRPNGSLDTMKASSPPRKKIIKGSIAQVASTDHDMEDYESWLLGYPSALDSFEKMMSRAKDKKIAIFLEYDGTLAPIYDHPYHAFMSESMRESLKKVARCFPTAIISGRSRDKVFDLVKLTELYYAGSHGMDIMGPVNETYPNCCVKSTDHQGKGITIFQPAREFLPMIDEVFRTLVEITKDIQGAKVENHKFCVSVHYRNVEENNWTTVGQCVHDVLENYPRLHSTHGRKVLEIRPVIDWNKGKAVEFLLESLGLTDRNDVLPIYIGDDQTDEDAFKVLRESNRGCGILISSVRRESNALYSLRDPSEVGELLHLLLNWKEETAIKEAYGKKIN